ncbi:MAG TPA: hypothetical protein ENI23_14155 [bacterium]|nr:hypothetical protein [bacterium]
MKLNHKKFLDNLFAELKKLNIDVSDATLDHLAYQAMSDEEYDELKPKFMEFAELIREPLVGNRRVGVFKLKKSLKYKKYSIGAIELIAPKEGQEVKSGLEHAEFLLPESLEDFIDRYPDVDWNTRAINRDQFPMLILQLAEHMQVKFPRFPILSD